MRLSHKIRKLTDPRILGSAKRHLGRVILPRRFLFRLDAEKIIESIDGAQFQAIHDRYTPDGQRGGWRKYLDLDRWIDINLRRVRDLELDWGGQKSILDLGAGAGFFLYICDRLGHRTLGLDTGDVPMFGEMFHALGLNRVISRVKAFQPLPPFDRRKFDLITAFMICFNGHKSPALWGPKEWAFFLDDLETRLNPGGRIRLGFNRERDDNFYTEELRQFFLDRGATIDQHRVTLRPGRGR